MKRKERTDNKIIVSVRVRPRLPNERGNDAWEIRNNSMRIRQQQPPQQPSSSKNNSSRSRKFSSGRNSYNFNKSSSSANINQKKTGKMYNFDKVFGVQANNYEVYDMTSRKIVEKCVEGFNGTIICYGQTSSGKTFTMIGEENEFMNDNNTSGILQLTFQDLFRIINRKKDRLFICKGSYIEIYNEKVRDLLTNESGLQIMENERGTTIVGVKKRIVKSVGDMVKILEDGERFRQYGETNMNLRSSRSHTIYRIWIESKKRSVGEGNDKMDEGNDKMDEDNDFGAVLVSELNFVDLAGSERSNKSGTEGLRLKEGNYINKSLLTLGTVINKLSSAKGRDLHIPYRESKLTRILKPALGNNSLCSMICMITQARKSLGESISTLNFASHAKTIENKAIVNEVVGSSSILVELQRKLLLRNQENKEYKQTIDGLKEDYYKSKEEKEILKNENERMKSEIEGLKNEIRENCGMKSEIERLKNQVESMKSEGERMKIQIQDMESELSEKKVKEVELIGQKELLYKRTIKDLQDGKAALEQALKWFQN